MRKLRMFLLALTILPICIIFSGCNDTKTENYEDNSHKRFVIIKKVQNNFYIDGNEIDIYIVVDKETKIMYIACIGFYRFSITPLLGKDGTPMQYEGEL